VLVEYADGHNELVEIKPSGLLKYPQVRAKLDAGKAYCESASMVFVVLTEVELGL